MRHPRHVVLGRQSEIGNRPGSPDRTGSGSTSVSENFGTGLDPRAGADVVPAPCSSWAAGSRALCAPCRCRVVRGNGDERPRPARAHTTATKGRWSGAGALGFLEGHRGRAAEQHRRQHRPGPPLCRPRRPSRIAGSLQSRVAGGMHGGPPGRHEDRPGRRAAEHRGRSWLMVRWAR